MKTTAALILALLIAAGGTACGNSGETPAEVIVSETTAVQETVVQSEKIVEDTDFLEFYLTGSGTDYLDLSIDEFNEKTGNIYIEQNALEYDPDIGFASFSLGEVGSLLDGRISLGGEFPVLLGISCKDGRIVRITYTVEKTAADAMTVSDAVAEYLKSNLSFEHTSEYDYPAAGKGSARFTDSMRGFVFSVFHFDKDSAGYPVNFTIETYSDQKGT